MSVPTRRLGRTEERVSLVGLGGFHIGHPYLPDDEAITFMDNSRDYNAGTSELRMGRSSTPSWLG